MKQGKTKFVNKYLRNFTPYSLASHKIWKVEPEERRKILKLDWNEAAISPSPVVKEMIEALVRGGDFYNYYPAVNNIELLNLISNYVELPIENIQYFASSDSLHEYIAKLYITVGDPILILGPSYDNFRLTAEICGGSLYFYNIGDDFVFDEDKFMEMINSVDPSLVYICNPNNPTGTQQSLKYIEKLLFTYPNVLFLLDEAYSEFSGITAKDMVLKHENILITRTMSKAFALANFRFGYLLASASNISYISRIRNPKNITTFAQVAAIGALKDLPYMRQYVKDVNDSKRYFIKELEAYKKYIRCNNGEGNFVLIICSSNEIKKGLIKSLEDDDIYVRDLSQTEYLKNMCFRVTIGLKEQMKRVKKSFVKYFEKTEG